jgi:hypothetical protein
MLRKCSDRSSSKACGVRHAVRRIFSAGMLTASIVLPMASAPAAAADMPVKAAPIEAGGGFYVWLDGSWDRVALPGYTLGPAYNVGIGGSYGGQILRLNSDVDGYNVSGGIGYRLPGNWPGSNARIEIGGLFVDAKGTGNQVTSYKTPGFGASQQLLDGRFTSSFGCVGTCTATTSLATGYQNSQLNLKFATDYKVGVVTLTPSVAVFGGEAHNGQSYALKTNNGFNPVMNEFYSANTRLKWNDVGVRAGLDTKAPLTGWLSVGLGGWVGVAGRRTDFTGTDSEFFVNSLGQVQPTLTSAAAAFDRTTAFVGNLEGNVYIQPISNMTLRLFGGLNYDSAVPGIRAPSFTGDFNFAAPTVAAGINHSSATSYYAGGGLKVGF